jgi:hypothetical protein
VQRPKQDRLSKFRNRMKPLWSEPYRVWNMWRKMGPEKQRSIEHNEEFGFHPKSNDNLLENF